ncbi:glycosyltransferase [Hymenobacter sp. RP-2-7]|uniref:Glycosyltransferase n=1 Tax=Hymenobacter polaris TaxID=2682546 RepID=A0A7Y0AFT5_9BACT|nr:glycosyltransferase family 4 protein [Hymenobacter polaris]NML66531.1 glycosyltransferase [Hymenobacter polaris]
MPDSAAALSVLVLAWDEAAPTVRAVVEAAPTIGSLLVLLPPALPEPAPAPPIPVAPAAKPTPAELANPAPALPPTLPPPTPALATATATAPAPPVPAPQPALPEATLPTPALGEPARAAAPGVRVVHVVASQPPATVRSGSFQVPAAPYLGATAPPAMPVPVATAEYPTQTLTTVSSLEPSPTPAPELLQNSKLVSSTSVVAEVETADSAATTSTTAPPQLTEAAAPATEAPPAGATAPAAPAPTEALGLPLAEAAFAAAEILDPNPEEELQSTSQQLPAAATPADSPRLSDPAPVGTSPLLGPFGNRLPQFDTSAAPAPRTTVRAAVADDPEDTPEERARVFAASVAAAQQYTAPDLNSQVIRYARLAVPLALAEGPYEVIYAPAWPTWLAALELRQRTLGPLVLHLPALAAGRQPADTAAGWPAELQRQVLRQADLVLVETYALARRLRRELGLGPATVRVVPTADAAAVARALRRARRRPGLA